MPICDFRVQEDGMEKPLLEAGLRGRDFFAHDADDLERCEHIVPVEWMVTRPVEEAVWESGLFTNQMTVCRLRDRATLEHLEAAFDLGSTLVEAEPTPRRATEDVNRQ
jgi:hypothetical protein